MGFRRLPTSALCALVLVGGMVVGAGPAQAAHVSCGETLVADTVLDSDIGPCALGVFIGADNITFDLNGHTITGNAGPGQGAGVLIDGRTGVVVRNGTVTGFDAGVVIRGGSGNSVLNMALTNNVGSFQTDFGDGVTIFNSTGNTVRASQITGNGPFSGISTVAANNNTFDSNQIVDNNLSPTNTAGIRLENIGRTPSSGNVVTNNLVVGSGTFGIQIFAGGTDNVIRNNQVARSALDGITAFAGAARNIVEGNNTRANGGSGIFIRGAAGVFGPTMNNQILRNFSFGNAVFDLRDGNPNCGTNEWHGNQGATGTPPCVFNP